MKLSNKILEKARHFYLEKHSLNETCRMIYRKYRIPISREGLRKRLIKIKTPMRSRSETIELFLRKKISNKKIEKILKLYREKLSSARNISNILNLDRRIVRRVLTESGVRIRENETAVRLKNTLHKKSPFSGNKKEKAYILGLLVGDLHAFRKSKYIIRITMSTTHKRFIEMLKKTFKVYGQVFIYPTRASMCGYQWNFSVDLDNSFDFLLKRKCLIPLNIGEECFIDFLAGLIDSDGSIIIRKAGKYIQFVIRVFGQEVKTLKTVKKFLVSKDISPKLYLNAKKGERRKGRNLVITYHKDYYVLELCRREDVIKLCKSLPLRHPEKIMMKKMILGLHKKGIKFYRDAGPKLKKIKSMIEDERKKYILDAKIKIQNKN